MKRIAFYGAILIVIAVCSLLPFRKHEEPPKPPAETPQPATSQAAQESQPPQGTQVTRVPGAVSPQAEPGRPLAVSTPATERIAELSNLLQTYSAQLQPPIAFYGKVLDESNRPIEGASVDLHWTHLFPPPEHAASTNTLSNPQGLFSLTGVTGATLVVYVSKEGYHDVKGPNGVEFSYSATFGSTPFQPDPKNPVVFHLRKKE